MAAYSRLRRGQGENADHWPGFVDALATLLLVVVFLLSLFAVAQYALGQALSGRDAQLAQADEQAARLRARIAELAASLSLEQAKVEEASQSLNRLQVTLADRDAAIADREQIIIALRGDLDAASERAVALETDLAGVRADGEAMAVQVSDLELQLAALNQQLAALNAALEASEARDLDQKAQIENLSSRLNTALASKVAQMAEFRSKFFEELASALGDRTDLRVVGDRFVFETDVLFASGSAQLSAAGLSELDKIAGVILDVKNDLPDDVDWVIRVDGHTDVRPISQTFASNWHLSAERAISVVNYFEDQGVPSQRLVAAGFGEHHPLDARRTEEAFAKNRRIELKLDNR